tara:strand:+ start:77 stop:340 length:264 start_codon:yes stop_codon:yes gene_type:complete
MAEIQCPHCDKNIELEDGLSGIFDCPYCHNEFIWGNEKQTKQISNHHINHHEPMPLGFKIVFGMIAGLILLVIFGYLFLLMLFDNAF